MMKRILFLAGYRHAAYHRKIEIMADAPDVEIVHLTVRGADRAAGCYPSANGQQQYIVRELSERVLCGQAGDPHRSYFWPPRFELATFKPHLIHIEAEQESLGTAQIALARSIRAPRTPLVCYSWQNILRQRSWPAQIVSNYTLHAVQHVICASTEAAEVLRRQGYRGGLNVAALTGLDRRFFYRQAVPELRRELALGGWVIGYVGRLVPEKGIDLLIRAVAHFESAEPAVQLLIVGSGPEKERLQSLARQAGVAERCRWVEAVPYEAINAYLNLLDVLVLPSRTTLHWKEQFGRVLVEAMACGVPVVGSTTGAIPDVIGDAGKIFPEDDHEALIRARLSSD
jgi:glycosyltransferase involved in cell wall biosynthesis